MKTLDIKIGGMTCGGCARSVTAVLSALPGMQNVAVDLDNAKATVTFDPAKLDQAAMAKAIEDAGYEAA